MQTEMLVKAAIKEKAPQMHAALLASGGLDKYAAELASQISSEVVSLTQQQRMVERWDKLGPMECAARMKTAASLAQEAVLAELLEFPQDGNSPPSLD